MKQVVEVLDDYKAQDVVVIPLLGKASFADFLVVASGGSSRHVSSMGGALEDRLGREVIGAEGLKDGEWVCMDMRAVVVHLFVPEKRALYNLEKLWSHAFDEADGDA